MKIDLPYSKMSSNIGDDVIVYSIYQIAKKQNVNLLNDMSSRDDLSKIQNINKTIVAGWLSFNENNSLPKNMCQENILLYGIHLKDEQHQMPLIQSIKDNNLEVGCRDTYTLDICRNHGIQSYISYCPTLLFDKCYCPKNYCTFVDAFDEEMMNYVKNKTKLEVKYITHRNYFNHNMSFEDRMLNIKRHLKLYSNSKFVITTKMHCALPCLSMGVPCLFYRHATGWDKKRLSDYYPFFNMFDNIDQLKQFDLNDIKNKDISKLTSNKNKLVQFITRGNQA